MTTTRTKTLGEILAETTREEKAHDLALAEARAAKQSAEELAHWNLAKDFFEASKAKLTAQIIDKEPIARVGVLVGHTGSRLENLQVYDLFKLYTGSVSVEKPSSPYYPLWKEFNDWITSQGMTAVWDYQYDGGGVHSWYVLKLVPAPAKHR